MTEQKPSERRKGAPLQKITDTILDEHHERLNQLEDWRQIAEGPCPIGADPGDSAALSRLRRCIDAHGVWPDEETEEQGDYEACVEHMGRRNTMLTNLVDDLKRNGAAHYLEDILRRNGIRADEDSFTRLQSGFQKMRARAEVAEAAVEAADEVLKSIESQTLGLFAKHGVGTPAEGFRDGGWGCLRKAIQDLGGKVEKAEAARDRIERNRNSWARATKEFRRELDELKKQLEAESQVSDSLRMERDSKAAILSACEREANRQEARADDYQQRFEALRGEVEEQTKTLVDGTASLFRRLLTRHPMPEGEGEGERSATYCPACGYDDRDVTDRRSDCPRCRLSKTAPGHQHKPVTLEPIRSWDAVVVNGTKYTRRELEQGRPDWLEMTDRNRALEMLSDE